jgi:hypothetical protein
MRRNAANGVPQQATVQYATEKGRRYNALRTVTTTDPRGYMQTKVAVPKSGSVRIAWHNPGGRPTYSRPVTVTT